MRKNVYFTSDWHIGHRNIIKFSQRPFKDVHHQSEALIKRFNAVVRKHDTTYFLGDMGMGSSETLKKVIDRLNGTKVIVLGNHDKGINSMYNQGFDVVLYGARLMIAQQIVTLTHCPLLGIDREDTKGFKVENENWHGETRDKTRKYTHINHGQFHLHGHIHSPNGGRSKKILGRQYDVGVDANNYSPVSLGTIESWICRTLKEEKK